MQGAFQGGIQRAAVALAIYGAWATWGDCRFVRADVAADPETRTAAPVAWETLARSVEGRAIEFAQFGSGPRHVLLIGPFSGREPEGLALAGRVAEYLTRFPRRLPGTTVTIVRDPNPDGRERGTLTNARDVALNRNFFSSDWHRLPTGDRWLSGREPDSEPETKAIYELLLGVRPELVLLLASDPSRPDLTYAGPALEVTRQAAAVGELPIVGRDPDSTSGSLESMAGVDYGLATVTVHLAAGTSPEANWTRYKRMLLFMLGGDDARFPWYDESAAAAAESASVNGLSDDASGAAPSNSDGPIRPARLRRLGSNEARDPRLPTMLRYEDLRAGAAASEIPRLSNPEGVAMASLGDTRERAGSSDQVAAETGPPESDLRTDGSVESQDSRIERLPPLEMMVAPHGSPPVATLPQRPIPFYRRTVNPR